MIKLIKLIMRYISRIYLTVTPVRQEYKGSGLSRRPMCLMEDKECAGVRLGGNGKCNSVDYCRSFAVLKKKGK